MSELETASPTGQNERLSENPVIDYLKKAHRRKDRAALANLRSGLRRRDGRAMEMYPYIGRFLSENTNRSREHAIFTVAALFAYYPDANNTKGDLGASLRELKNDEGDSVEKRFVALLNAEAEDLPVYLRQIIGLLKSNEKPVGVNWEKLFDDIVRWESDSRFVQKRWARSFWGDNYNENNQENSTGEEK